MRVLATSTPLRAVLHVFPILSPLLAPLELQTTTIARARFETVLSLWDGSHKVTLLFGLSDNMWGLLSTIPFLYIMYVLFVEISKSLAAQSPKVQGLLKTARTLLVATWGVYPITFILAMNNTGAPSFSDVVAREVGYSIADILAKCVFGLLIFTVARVKSAEESKEFAATEFKD
jgi:hypothetical protein